MAARFRTKDRVLETSVTTGTGTYTLAGAATGFQTFAGGSVASGDKVPYYAEDGTNWEAGIGEVLTGPSRLVRETILSSSNGGAAVDWGAGTRNLRCGWPAELNTPRVKSVSIAGGAGDQALTQTEQRCDILILTGALTGNRAAVVDTAPWKWIVLNSTTGSFSTTVKVTGQTGVVVAQGKSKVLYCDGTDVEDGSTDVHVLQPGGRVTLTTAVPVLTADAVAQGTVYYTPYQSDQVPIYDGSAWSTRTFTELSQTLADNTKSPAAAANNSNYDMFVWDDAGTLRCTRGPAWTSDTARGAGAGTTELEMINGKLVNKVAIANGPAARRGLFVSTIRTNGTATVDWRANPAAAAGGGDCRLCVWNMYNRVEVSALTRDSTDSWTYNSATLRAQNNNAANRISYIHGLSEDSVKAQHLMPFINAAGDVAIVGIGIDSTSVLSGVFSRFNPTAQDGVALVPYMGYPGLGFHFVQPLEANTAAGGNITFYGDRAVAYVQSGTFLNTRM